MNKLSAVDCLSALAQETRLNIFRLLVQNAPKGLPAGEIARRLKLPGPTLSFHLNILAATELIQAERNGRSIFYSPYLKNVNRLMIFLTENCCGGRSCAIDVARTPQKKSKAQNEQRKHQRNR
jgi:ArsR family transcriptional regulator, arsenate/arsenite/antimonite-responsive transcriptional repressor